MDAEQFDNILDMINQMGQVFFPFKVADRYVTNRILGEVDLTSLDRDTVVDYLIEASDHEDCFGMFIMDIGGNRIRFGCAVSGKLYDMHEVATENLQPFVWDTERNEKLNLLV